MFNISNQPNSPYDKKKVNILVLKIKKCVDENKSNKFKIELFNLMNKVIVKNINNYLKLTTNSPIKSDSNNFLEMQSEAFIILVKCVDGFKIKDGNDFYFYFNKSLSRNFFRFFSQHIREKKRGDMVSDFIKLFSPNPTNEIDEDIEFLIQQLGFSKDEQRILLSKIYNQNKSDFLSKNKDFNSEKYNSCMTIIKEMLNKLRDKDEY